MISSHSPTGSSGSNGAKQLSSIYVGAAGTANSERTGNMVVLKRLWISGITYQSAGSLVVGNPYDMPIGRILIILVRDNNGDSLIAPGGNTDLASILSDFGVANPIHAPLRPEFRSKIKILWDYRFNLANTTVGANTQPWGKVLMWRKYINLAKHIKGPTTFNASAGGPGNSERNHVFIFFLQTATPTLAGSITTNWQHRLSFLP